MHTNFHSNGFLSYRLDGLNIQILVLHNPREHGARSGESIFINQRLTFTFKLVPKHDEYIFFSVIDMYELVNWIKV